MTCVRTLAWVPALMLIAVCWAAEADSQQAALARLPRDVFDVVPPSAHVRGLPGAMTVRPQACRTLATGQARRRIVEVAAQEWGFFGFRILDQTDVSRAAAFERDATGASTQPDRRERTRRRSRLTPEEAARVAASIAGYWAVTPEGAWIVERQNDEWNGPDGIASRWNAPWSAAFVSWVMCEAGLGAAAQFQRAIAHHAYIDQAIRARDGRAPQAAFAAYDVGEADVTPGDLLCSSRRPAYRSIAERRRQAGVGARSHCDVVVKVDDARQRILAIGGNVRGTVSLKVIRASRAPGAPLRAEGAGGGERPIFAHLKLRAEAIAANALDVTPTMTAVGCEGAAPPVVLAGTTIEAVGLVRDRC